MRILLVEDEPKLNEFLHKGLEQQGYLVDGVENGASALELAAVHRYGLIILDLMLPGQTGYEVLSNLRSFNINIPVLVISALSGTENVVRALDMGAADYLKKPFDFEELLARIRVISRKGAHTTWTKMQVGDITLDRVSRKVFVGGREVDLTKREFVLLEHLMLNTNRIVSKTEIAESVWEISFDTGSNVIEVHLSSLRKKLGEQVIKTKVGLGYYMDGSLIKS